MMMNDVAAVVGMIVMMTVDTHADTHATNMDADNGGIGDARTQQGKHKN